MERNKILEYYMDREKVACIKYGVAKGYIKTFTVKEFIAPVRVLPEPKLKWWQYLLKWLNT